MDTIEITTLARALTMLNRNGDTTITWEPENDEAMAEIIQRQMDAGVTFYIIKPRNGTRGRTPKPKKLAKVADAMEHRAISIPDEDLAKFCLAGKGSVAPTPAEPAQTVKRAKTAREVASGHAIGVAPRAGG